MVQAAGPLGSVVQVVDTGVSTRSGYRRRLGAGSNTLVLLSRTAFVDRGGRGDDQARRALLQWMAAHRLGQDRELVARVAARRKHALERLRARGLTVVRLQATPMWRLAVGLGNQTNAHETGLALHGTYGWPVIPGSTLKGLTCAWALQSSAAPDQVAVVFGLPRVQSLTAPADASPADDQPRASRGGVRFLDALPVAAPVRVALDVLTPLVQPYYTDTSGNADGAAGRQPPAECHNPVPVQFLVIDGGSFAIDLVGRSAEHVERAADWCAAAFDELGTGAKTAAGYGYLKVDARETLTGDAQGATM